MVLSGAIAQCARPVVAVKQHLRPVDRCHFPEPDHAVLHDANAGRRLEALYRGVVQYQRVLERAVEQPGDRSLPKWENSGQLRQCGHNQPRLDRRAYRRHPGRFLAALFQLAPTDGTGDPDAGQPVVHHHRGDRAERFPTTGGPDFRPVVGRDQCFAVGDGGIERSGQHQCADHQVGGRCRQSAAGRHRRRGRATGRRHYRASRPERFDPGGQPWRRGRGDPARGEHRYRNLSAAAQQPVRRFGRHQIRWLLQRQLRLLQHGDGDQRPDLCRALYRHQHHHPRDQRRLQLFDPVPGLFSPVGQRGLYLPVDQRRCLLHLPWQCGRECDEPSVADHLGRAGGVR